MEAKVFAGFSKNASSSAARAVLMFSFIDTSNEAFPALTIKTVSHLLLLGINSGSTSIVVVRALGTRPASTNAMPTMVVADA